MRFALLAALLLIASSPAIAGSKPTRVVFDIREDRAREPVRVEMALAGPEGGGLVWEGKTGTAFCDLSLMADPTLVCGQRKSVMTAVKIDCAKASAQSPGSVAILNQLGPNQTIDFWCE
jgi:hypothetical protein